MAKPDMFLSGGHPDLSAVQTGAKDSQAPSSNPMDAFFREAVLVNGNPLADGFYTFPYPKLIDGVRPWVHFRRNVRNGELFFSIDIGTFSEDKIRLESKAFVDFSIGNLSGITKQLVGIVGCSHEKPLCGPIPVQRPDEQSTEYSAIFVQDFWRGGGLGKALIDGVIVVLREQPIAESGERVRFLVFDGISDLRAGTQPGEFYRGIRDRGGRVCRRYQDERGRQRGRMIVPMVSPHAS